MNAIAHLYDEVLRAFLALRHPNRAARAMVSTNHDRLHDLLDIASANQDVCLFQKTLNLWLKTQTHCGAALFLVRNKDCSIYCCQVIDNVLMPSPDDLACDSITLSSLFDDSEVVTGADIPHELSTQLVANIRKAGEMPEASCSLKSLSTGCNISMSLMPVRARSGLVAALCLVYKTKNVHSGDSRWTRTHLRTIGALMSMVLNVDEQRRLANQSQIFLSMAKNVFSSLEDMSLLIRNITKEAKSLVQSETCSIFLLDKERQELVAEVFEKDGKHDEYLSEIRLPLDKGIAGQVATKGTMMNVKDAYNSPQFYHNIDDSTGFHTRNILCFPITDPSGNLVGVAELCNKIGGSHFSRDDELIASTFSVYCAISISHCLLYRSLQEAHRRSHLASEMVATDCGSDKPVAINSMDIHALTHLELRSPLTLHDNFSSFAFLPRQLDDPMLQLEACINMFHDLGLINSWRIKRSTLAKFLLRVQSSYRLVPYHNWSHAFAVAHFAYLLLKQPSVSKWFSELEKLCLLVAALCHDVDHRGTNNAFQVKSQTPLAQLYSSEGSVLEHHHFAQTVCILNMEGNNVLESLSSEEYQAALDYIRDIILSTDIAQHLKKFTKLSTMAQAGFDENSKRDHYLMLCLMMTSSDLSDQTKHWVSSKKIAMTVYQEFFSQGDLERAMGSAPSEMMDRQRACVPKLQLDFLDQVAIPVFQLLSSVLSNTEQVLKSIVHCRKCWQTLQQLVNENKLAQQTSPTTEEQDWQQGGLTELEDPLIEQMVLKRVEGERCDSL